MHSMPIRELVMAAAAVAMCCGPGGCAGAGCSSPHGVQMPPDDSQVIDGMGPPPIDGGTAIGPLRVDLQNPRYFTTGDGKALYLTGSHTWGNLKDRAHVDPPPPFDYPAFLDFLVAHRHNFFRLWTWEQPHSFDDDPNNLLYFGQFAYQRT